jgi:hypothetical protein
MRNNEIKFWLYVGLTLIGVWIAITSTIQRFFCFKLSETELFLKIPKNFILRFDECDKSTDVKVEKPRVDTVVIYRTEYDTREGEALDVIKSMK